MIYLVNVGYLVPGMRGEARHSDFLFGVLLNHFVMHHPLKENHEHIQHGSFSLRSQLLTVILYDRLPLKWICH